VVLVALTADKVVCVASAPDNVLEKRPKGARTVVEVFCVASPRLVDRAALDLGPGYTQVFCLFTHLSHLGSPPLQRTFSI
jgi:hypothetical protein